MYIISFIRWEDLHKGWEEGTIITFWNFKSFNAWVNSQKDDYAICLIQKDA